MERDAIIEFARRDRSFARSAKRSRRADLFRRGGSAATFRASQALLRHYLWVRGNGEPIPRGSEDLEHHIQLKQKLDRAAVAFARR